jgi:hypothetical protein
MRRLLWVVAALLVTAACAPQETLVTAGPGEFRSVWGQPDREGLALQALASLRERIDVDASHVDLVFVTSAEEQQADCKGRAACTGAISDGYDVVTYWPDEWTVDHPDLLAHELCHVWAYQQGDSTGDLHHTRTECFAQPGYYQSYPGEIGYAWDSALEVAAAYGKEVQ